MLRQGSRGQIQLGWPTNVTTAWGNWTHRKRIFIWTFIPMFQGGWWKLRQLVSWKISPTELAYKAWMYPPVAAFLIESHFPAYKAVVKGEVMTDCVLPAGSVLCKLWMALFNELVYLRQGKSLAWRTENGMCYYCYIWQSRRIPLSLIRFLFQWHCWTITVQQHALPRPVFHPLYVYIALSCNCQVPSCIAKSVFTNGARAVLLYMMIESTFLLSRKPAFNQCLVTDLLNRRNLTTGTWCVFAECCYSETMLLRAHN